MVSLLRIGLLTGAALLFGGCALSAPPAGFRPVGGLAVTTLEITERGAGSPNIAPSRCRSFDLDEATVRLVLKVSDTIGRDQYMHQRPWSPCLVRGRLEVSDGRQGTWTVRQYGSGSVLFDDGAEWFFWCKTCTWPPFVAVE